MDLGGGGYGFRNIFHALLEGRGGEDVGPESVPVDYALLSLLFRFDY